MKNSHHPSFFKQFYKWGVKQKMNQQPNQSTFQSSQKPRWFDIRMVNLHPPNAPPLGNKALLRAS